MQRGSCLIVRLTQDVVSGDVLQMDYGVEILDAKIALDYGVMDHQILKVSWIQTNINWSLPSSTERSSSIASHVVLTTGFLQGGYFLQLEIPQADPYFDDKVDILELESGSSSGFRCDLLAQQDPPPELLAFLRLLNCSGSLCFVCRILSTLRRIYHN